MELQMFRMTMERMITEARNQELPILSQFQMWSESSEAKVTLFRLPQFLPADQVSVFCIESKLLQEPCYAFVTIGSGLKDSKRLAEAILSVYIRAAEEGKPDVYRAALN